MTTFARGKEFKAVEKEPLRSSYEDIRLALFIDSSILSRMTVAQLRKIARELSMQDSQIQVYRVDRDIDKLIEFNIIACPTLLRLDKRPHECLVGELSDPDVVKAFLNR